ncbi:hypothetical protein ABE205_19455 [Brevibacillus agri]|uniref:hypothetical protein n=1 Tax=Brevibacillus agri TaxID=51101 RepID=UPI003D2184A5
MKAGRELNAKVAEALGYKIISGEIDNVNPVYSNGHRLKDMDFSGSWSWMGVLVEEAKKQGIYLEYSHSLNGGYYAGAYSFDNGEYQIDYSTDQAVPTAPHAVALVYLMAKGVIANA